MSFTFPAGILDNPEETLNLLGTFWQQLYQGRTTAWSFCRGKNEVERQTHLEVLGAADALSREKCPVFNRQLWKPLYLKLSDKQTGYPLAYGDGSLYGDSNLVYGGGSYAATAWSLSDAGAADLRDCLVVTGGVASPGVVLVSGVDFTVDPARRVIIFRDDPFGTALLTPEATADGDTALTLWAFQAGVERHTVRDQYGYALGLFADSSTYYRELVDAVLDGLSGGPTLEVIHRALSAVTGVPLAKEVETVEAVASDANWLLVMTDKNVYRFPKGSTALVAAGTALTPGDPLVDTVLVDMPNGAAPTGLSSLQVPASFFAGVTAGPLTFANAPATLTVTTGVGGKTKLTWPMVDDAGDVAAFFDAFHAKGVAAGKTLANYLDRRPAVSQTTEPTADNLPTTVNPLQLLFQNVFRGNLILVRVKSALLHPDALGLDYQWALRRVLPPTTALLIVAQ